MLTLDAILRFSLPGVYHIAFLMVVIFFVYSIAAMALFGSVKHGNYIDAYGNFETFPTAVLTLFRCAFCGCQPRSIAYRSLRFTLHACCSSRSPLRFGLSFRAER